MPVRNASVARGYLSATGYTTVYTVPTGFVLLLKNILISQTSGQASTFNFNFVSSGATVNIVWFAATTASDGTYNWSGWTVLNAGDALRINVGTPTVAYWVSGAVLPYFPGP